MRKTHLTVLAIAVAVVILAIGAVGAYADIASDAEPPQTTTDAAASYWNTAAITIHATDNEGVAYIYYKLDGHPVRLSVIQGGPKSADVSCPTSPFDTLRAGTHTLKYWAQDINGNVEAIEAQNATTFTLAMDADKPATTATGATDGAWYKAAVVVHLAAADGDGGSGVKELSYSLDGATAVTGASAAADVTVPAVAGAHTIVYSATDVAGNVEDEKTLTVNVDTIKPVTSATAVSVAKGRTATLKYKVSDADPNKGTATVVIKIKNRAGKVVKTIKARSKSVNVALTAKFRCSFAKGVYKYYVYATDASGNAQAKAGYAKLTVK